MGICKRIPLGGEEIKDGCNHRDLYSKVQRGNHVGCIARLWVHRESHIKSGYYLPSWTICTPHEWPSRLNLQWSQDVAGRLEAPPSDQQLYGRRGARAKNQNKAQTRTPPACCEAWWWNRSPTVISIMCWPRVLRDHGCMATGWNSNPGTDKHLWK